MPYQLHCEPLVVGVEDELTITLLDAELTGALDELLTTLLTLEELDEEAVTPLQTLPVTAGRSVAPPFFDT